MTGPCAEPLWLSFPTIRSLSFLLVAAQRDTGIMGCSSSVSVMHDEVEDTGVTRVIYTDATGQEFVQHSAPFKEGIRRFNSMRISDKDASGIFVPLASTHSQHVKQFNKFLAAIEQNPRLLEKRVLPSQLPKHCKQAALMKVDLDQDPGLQVVVNSSDVALEKPSAIRRFLSKAWRTSAQTCPTLHRARAALHRRPQLSLACTRPPMVMPSDSLCSLGW
eukprot:s3134_g4.t1